MRVTIREVAVKAGVSPITVSRALHKPGLVHPATVAKVQQAVIELNYRPNQAAQGLRSGRSHVVLLVVKQKLSYDPLLFEFALGVSETFKDQGYSLLIHLTPDGNVSLEDVRERADGLILTDIEEQDVRVAELSEKIPLAIFGESELPVSQVDIDDTWGAGLATEHLLSLGYRDIAMVAGDGRMLFMKHRIQGYVDTIRNAGGSPTIAYGSLDIGGGEMAMHSFGRTPEAVLCGSDSMAVGVLRFLLLHGTRLPVVGCDGLQIGEITTPKLTSVKLPFYEAGLRLGQAILDVMNGQGPVKIRIRPDLIIRESTWQKSLVTGKLG